MAAKVKTNHSIQTTLFDHRLIMVASKIRFAIPAATHPYMLNPSSYIVIGNDKYTFYEPDYDQARARANAIIDAYSDPIGVTWMTLINAPVDLRRVAAKFADLAHLRVVGHIDGCLSVLSKLERFYYTGPCIIGEAMIRVCAPLRDLNIELRSEITTVKALSNIFTSIEDYAVRDLLGLGSKRRYHHLSFNDRETCGYIYADCCDAVGREHALGDAWFKRGKSIHKFTDTNRVEGEVLRNAARIQ